MNEQLYYGATHATGTLLHVVLYAETQSPHLSAKFAIFEFKIGQLRDSAEKLEKLLFFRGLSGQVRGLCSIQRTGMKWDSVV